MLRFLVDESTGKKLHDFLIDKGLDSKFVSDIIPSALDKDVLKLAEKEKRILVTNDKDFGELVFRLNMPSSGVVLMRLKIDNSQNRQKCMSALLGNFLSRLQSNFTVVSESQTRFKKIPQSNGN
ncbi:MAG TPA: DUF5615 family PIN-like protein [archaeon]|nr:DUF5615 family PIN-like protein [archaeon]